MEAYYTCSYIAALHSGRVFWLDKYTQYTHWTKIPDFAHCDIVALVTGDEALESAKEAAVAGSEGQGSRRTC